MANVIVRNMVVRFVIIWWMLIQYIAPSCDQGWFPDYRVKACFKLYDKPKLKWTEAKRFCDRRNAYLSDLADFAEQKFVNTTILGDRHMGHGAWLGGNDKNKGVWRWVNNARMNIDLFLWRKGNPDNGNVIFELGELGENCLEIAAEAEYRGQLNDYRCGRKLAFVCKSTKMFTITTTVVPTTNSTTEIHRKQTEKDKPKMPTIAIVVSLLSLLAVVSFVIVALLICRKRKRKGSPHLYADAVHISTNEHFYTGLDSTSHDNHDNINTFEQPRVCVDKTGSREDLLQSQYSEPNLYESLEDSPNSTGSFRYRATGGENGLEAINAGTNDVTKPTNHLKVVCRLNQSSKGSKGNSDKSCLGNLDMDAGHDVELSKNKRGRRAGELKEQRKHIGPDPGSHNTAISGKIKFIQSDLKSGKEQTSTDYLTPFNGMK